jgi:peptidoglycan hydrolase-like amidase
MGGDYPYVVGLTVYNCELIAGGLFSTAGGVSANYIARWNGTSWQPLGTGMGGIYRDVYALTVYNGELIAGGQFTTAGGNPANYVARWGCAAPAPCSGDMNCDGRVTFADIDPFVEALGGESAWNQNHPGCPWRNADCNASGTVTFADIDPFVAVIGTTCP